MSVLRKLASQTVLYGVTYFAGRLLNFLLTPFYTRIFAPAAYGAVTEVYAYIVFFNVLYTYGMETGYFYFANKEKSEDEVAGTTFLSLLFSSVAFSGLLMLFAQPIADWLGYPDRPQYIVYTALILFFDTLMVIPFAYLRKHDKAARFALLKFINIALNIAFNLFFLVLCPALLARPNFAWLHPFLDAVYRPGFGVGYVFLSNVLASLLTLLLLLPEMRKIKFRWHKQLWINIFKYSWPLLILGFAGMVNETMDRILLKRLLLHPPKNLSLTEAMNQLGIYSAAYKLSIFMTLAIQSFRYAAEPFFFSQMKEEGGKAIYARILKYFSFVTSLIFLGVMLYIPLFAKLLGPAFRTDEGMAVVPILLLANLFSGTFIYLSQWYKQTGKTLYGAMISVGGALLTLAINIIFIPYYGFMASAWATFICYLSMAVISYVLGQKFYPVAYNTSRIIWYIASAVLLYFASIFIQESIFDGWNIAMYLINTLFLLVYLMQFLYLEKPAFLLDKIRRK